MNQGSGSSPSGGDRFCRLSELDVWKAQRDYFAGAGIEAWRSGTVPHYVTNTPYLARAFAQIAAAYGRDTPASDEPLHIVELGAGSGRFGHGFVRALERMGLGVPFVYVLTDIAEANLEFWFRHPRLQPLFERGILDVARFDLERDDRLELRRSGRVVHGGDPLQRMAVVANYVLDSVPQDVFRVSGGRLYEALVDRTGESAKRLEGNELFYSRRRIDPNGYYGDEELERVLAEYAELLDDAVVLFPCAALRALGRLRRLCRGRMLLLSADKGCTAPSQMAGLDEPGLVEHGSVSLDVNYHAIGAYVTANGGAWLAPEAPASILSVNAFVLGSDASRLPGTRAAYELAVNALGPDAFLEVKRALEPRYGEMTVPQILSYLRMSGWDAKLICDAAPSLLELAADAAADERRQVERAVLRIWDEYYPIGEARDAAFILGLLLLEYGCPDKAAGLLAASIEAYGPDVACVYNLALCYLQMGRVDTARGLATAALQGVLDLGPARDLLTVLRAA